MKFKSITKIQKADLLNETTLSKLERNLCPQCSRKIDSENFYSLVGRNKILTKEDHFKFVGGSGLPEIQTTTKYAYQGCFIPLCEFCYKRYKKLEKVATASAILLVIGIVGTFGSILIYGVSKIKVGFGLPFFILFMTTSFIFWFLKSVFLNSERFSSKTVKLDYEFLNAGIPDTSEDELPIVVTKEEVKKLLGD